MSMPMTHHWIPDDLGMECETCGLMMHMCIFNESHEHVWGVSGDCYICGNNQFFCAPEEEGSDMPLTKNEVGKLMSDEFKKHYSKIMEELPRDPVHDPVHNPSHYTSGSVECIDAIRSALGDYHFAAYCRGQAIKYLWRADKKENYRQDAEKAMWYIRKMLDVQDDLIEQVKSAGT